MALPSLAVVFGLLGTCFCGHLEFDSTTRAEWKLWKQEHSKVYSSSNEETYRSYVWLENMDFIQTHNQHAEKHGYTLRMNRFGDMTESQWKDFYLGYSALPNATRAEMKVFKPVSTYYPEEVDWRSRNAVVQVKDQLRCNASYAFSAARALEGAIALAHGTLDRLSEQNIVDCSIPYGNHACHSGHPYLAYMYIIDAGGIDLEKRYKYNAMQGQCMYHPQMYPYTRISGVVSIERGNEKDLMAAVATVGPISVAVDASSNAFRFYHSGVFDIIHCSSTRLNHAMVLIGYGADYRGKKYWLLQNSYGPHWGELGYIKMAKDSFNQCGIATDALYPTL